MEHEILALSFDWFSRYSQKWTLLYRRILIVLRSCHMKGWSRNGCRDELLIWKETLWIFKGHTYCCSLRDVLGKKRRVRSLFLFPLRYSEQRGVGWNNNVAVFVTAHPPSWRVTPLARRPSFLTTEPNQSHTQMPAPSRPHRLQLFIHFLLRDSRLMLL